MTSLSDLNDGVVGNKPWLNPVVNNLSANIINTNSINITGHTGATGGSGFFYVGKTYSSVAPRIITSSSATLSVDDIISGVIGGAPIFPNLQQLYTLPSVGNLNSATAGITGQVYFKTQLSQVTNVGPIGSTGSLQISLPPGYTGINGETSALVYSRDASKENRFNTTLVFSKTPPSTDWIVFG